MSLRVFCKLEINWRYISGLCNFIKNHIKILTYVYIKTTIRKSINYCCVPGKQEPAFVRLADTCTCHRCKCLQNQPHKPMHFEQGVPVARIQEHYSHRAGCRRNREVTKYPIESCARIAPPLLFSRRPAMVVFGLNIR